ncbi:elongation factor 1-alpha C-terminal domain-related protein [Blattabacterium clevelandi]|uniref:elongation factor 1-alpha C-terminal domain-related protein n=1 Tax=Blattabacterium clevelandi TaxID=164516 RepID=UPI001F177D05|nr:hypothetical protein [Blattabacterium clevelandi]
MDLINYDFRIYKAIISKYPINALRVGFKKIIETIPISEKNGDNVVSKSTFMKWDTVPNLLSLLLENIVIQKLLHLEPFRVPVQYFLHSKNINGNILRVYEGKIISGIYRVGDEIIVYPYQSKRRCIEMNRKRIQEVFFSQSIIMYLEDEIDIYHRDLILVKSNEPIPIISKEFYVIIFWMENFLLKRENKYLFQIHSLKVPIFIKYIIYRIDVNTFKKRKKCQKYAILNDLVKVIIKSSNPIPYDTYQKMKKNRFSILIYYIIYSTVENGMIQ